MLKSMTTFNVFAYFFALDFVIQTNSFWLVLPAAVVVVVNMASESLFSRKKACAKKYGNTLKVVILLSVAL